MFRSFQGWTALTPQGPGDGTLQVMPFAKGMIYLLLRPLMADVPDELLCGAEPARAFSVEKEWHPLLQPALSPIPHVEPGDTVWWHPDIVHAVEDEHRGKGYSNVIYIAAAPWCAKNAAYLEKQKTAFLSGKSAPDFSAEDYEVDFEGRATPADLSDLGRKQMGLQAWCETDGRNLALVRPEGQGPAAACEAGGGDRHRDRAPPRAERRRLVGGRDRQAQGRDRRLRHALVGG
jgi:hypothetical protein